MIEPDLVAEIRERHFDLETLCHFCNQLWPCDAIRAADAIERLREEVERLQG